MSYDTKIMITIVSIFILAGIAIPFVDQEFGTSTTNYNVEQLQSDLGDEAENLSLLSVPVMLLSLSKMFFWTFSSLPWWLDAVFLIMGITLLVLFVRIMRGV